MTVTRNRIRLELGKGIEALRHEECQILDGLNAKTQVAIIGPFETDIDVKEVEVTAGIVPASSTNTIDLFNGTVSANKPIITQFDPDTLTAQVPLAATLTPANVRVKAGTPISVRYVSGGDNSSAPASVRVRVGYDIPIDGYSNAKVTTYGGYTDGQ